MCVCVCVCECVCVFQLYAFKYLRFSEPEGEKSAKTIFVRKK